MRTEITSTNKETDVVTPVRLVESALFACAAGAIIIAGMEKFLDIRLAQAESAAIAVCVAQIIADMSNFSPTALLL